VEGLQGQLTEQSAQMADLNLHFETLLSQCETLQAQIDAHQKSDQALKRQHKDLSCKYDLLKEDLNKISGQKREIQDLLSSATGHSAMLKAAYLHVFPYSHYRAIRPDLDSMDDIEIADHFFMYGLNEGYSIQDFMR
jgi:chromosome segregation ATPase